MNLSQEQISLNLVQWFEEAVHLLKEGKDGQILGIHVRTYRKRATKKMVLHAINDGKPGNFEFLELLISEMLKHDSGSSWQVFLREQGIVCTSILYIGGHSYYTDIQPPLYSHLPTLVP